MSQNVKPKRQRVRGERKRKVTGKMKEKKKRAKEQSIAK